MSGTASAGLRRRWRRWPLFGVIFAGIALCGGFITQRLSNPATPPGFVGYVTRNAVFGSAAFVALQTGPASTGIGWMLAVTNVPVTPRTTSEEFAGDSAVLSADSLKIAFRVHMVWRVRPDAVRDFVEHYAGGASDADPEIVLKGAYDNFLREPLRTYARDEVQRLKGLDIKDRITPVGEAITRRILALSAGTPFDVRSVVVGNIQYPAEVTDAVSQKLATGQALERKTTEIEITRKEKEQRIIEAEGIAAATAIISERLNAAYLQYEAIKAQAQTANSPNHTTIYIPVGPMGVPLVGAVDMAPPPAPRPGG